MTQLIPYYPDIKFRFSKTVKISLQPLIFIVLLSTFQLAQAQDVDERNPWTFGLQAGVLTGNLPTASATNSLISRFNVENNYYFTAAAEAGYTLSEFESLNLTVSRGEFSVFTDHEFWPDVIFKNQFYSADLSAHLGLRRFVGSLPERLNPYGSFGLGLMSNRNTVSPLNPGGTAQRDFSGDTSKNLSFLIKAGFGLDYSLNSRISLIFQFNHHFLSTDIIDKNLAGDVLRNEFVQTTNNWSTFTSGIRLKFGRAKVRTQPETVRDDFQIVSTISADRLLLLEEQISDLNDSIDRNTAESDSAVVQKPLDPIVVDVEDEIENDSNVPNPDEISKNEKSISTEDLDDDSEDQMTSIQESSENAPPFIEEPPVDNSDDEIPTPQENFEYDLPISPEFQANAESELTDAYRNDVLNVTQPKYGLNGIVTEEIPGYFTITLHSFTDHDTASSAILELNDEGYRVVSQIVNINGIEYKRVGIGQFESRRDARSAAENLPEPYRSNYFIVQI